MVTQISRLSGGAQLKNTCLICTKQNMKDLGQTLSLKKALPTATSWKKKEQGSKHCHMCIWDPVPSANACWDQRRQSRKSEQRSALQWSSCFLKCKSVVVHKLTTHYLGSKYRSVLLSVTHSGRGSLNGYLGYL